MDNLNYHKIQVSGTLGPLCALLGPRMPVGHTLSDSREWSKRKLGYYVITKLSMKNPSMPLLVNLGWLPMDNVSLVHSAEFASSLARISRVSGLIDMNDERSSFFLAKHDLDRGIFQYKDLNALFAFCSAEDLPDNSSTPIFINCTDDLGLGLLPSPKTISKKSIPHIEYMLTWFAFGLFSSAMIYSL